MDTTSCSALDSGVAGLDAQALDDRINDRVEALVAAAPPLSAGQRERLAAILGGAAPARLVQAHEKADRVTGS
jgi:hypothetical protein